MDAITIKISAAKRESEGKCAAENATPTNRHFSCLAAALARIHTRLGIHIDAQFYSIFLTRAIV